MSSGSDLLRGQRAGTLAHVHRTECGDGRDLSANHRTERAAGVTTFANRRCRLVTDRGVLVARFASRTKSSISSVSGLTNRRIGSQGGQVPRSRPSTFGMWPGAASCASSRRINIGSGAVVRPRWQGAGLDRCRAYDPALGCRYRPRGTSGCGARSALRSLAVSPADGSVFTGADDGTVRRWDPSSGRLGNDIGRVSPLRLQCG